MQADLNTAATTLVPPYGGGSLISLIVAAEEQRKDLVREAIGLNSIQLTPRALCDLELLATGAFSPLDRFMGEADYRSVLESMRLSNGLLFPIPITLAVDRADGLEGRRIALRSPKNNLLAVMQVEEIYECDRLAEACAICDTDSDEHPFAAELRRWGRFNISGSLEVIELPKYYDMMDLRLTPAQVRDKLSQIGSPDVVAFQSRNPMHRVHEELTKRAMDRVHGTLLLHPAVGLTKPGDTEHYVRIQTYRKIYSKYYDRDRTLLSVLPLAMRMAGPREAVWHAIIRRNYGANHFIVGRDHAGPGSDSCGRCFYPAEAAIQAVQAASPETGVTPVVFGELGYLPEENRYEEVDLVAPGQRVWRISGTEVREKYLATGQPLPEWYSRRETAEILMRAHRPRHERGFCLWFTGLPSAGKSTIAEIVSAMLMERGRCITLLDGDVVRTHLSKGLGFSRQDRDTNIRRIGFVASEIVRHNGIVVCAAVSPYESTRTEVRRMIGDERFIVVYVSTPVSVCEQRDVKGFYAKARSGAITGFTGVDDPYEEPPSCEIRLETVQTTPEENAQTIVDWLMDRKFLSE